MISNFCLFVNESKKFDTKKRLSYLRRFFVLPKGGASAREGLVRVFHGLGRAESDTLDGAVGCHLNKHQTKSATVW